MDDDEKSAVDGADAENEIQFPEVSRVTFDERTGTVTLRLTENREQLTVSREQLSKNN